MDKKEKEDFFDATIDDKIAQNYEARAKFESQKRVINSLSDEEIKRQNKRNYIKIITLSLVSTLTLLVLAIVFFLFLKWYAVGVVFAILGILLSQVWVYVIKKLNKNIPEIELLEESNKLSQQSQENLEK